MRETAKKVVRQCAGKTHFIAAGCLFLAVLPVTAFAEYYEIDAVRPFGLLDVDGHARVGYLFDERDYGSSDTDNVEAQSSWEEEFYLRTRSFVYHPGFLNMVIGGGPVFVQQQFESTGGDARNRETLLNFESRLNFLDIKTYPFSLYYEQSHPSVTRGLSGRFIVKNQQYGFKGALTQLFKRSTGINVFLTRRAASGSGFGYSVDDETEQATFRVQTSYRKSDQIAFTYDRSNLDSASGSPGLPIHESTQVLELAELRLENRFGDEDQFDLFQSLSRSQRDLANAVTSKVDDHRYRAKLTWQYDEMTRAHFRYNFADLKRSDADSLSQNLDLSLNRRLSENADVGAGYERLSQEDPGFRRDDNAFRGRATYTRVTGFGSFTLGARLRKANTDQESTASDIPVFDEAIVLVGSNPVNLAQEFVVPGSVVVRNVTNTQIYVEGTDYRLLQTGSVTSIQRLIDGNITDGETVLVDYRYETSGTAKFDTLESDLTASLTFLQNLDAYVRYGFLDTEVRSGELTNRVNDRDRLEYGLNIRNRTLDGWVLSGYYRHVQQDEDISPFVSDAVGVDLAKSFWGRLNVSASAGLTRSDYEFSDEDVNLRSYTLGLGARPIRRVLVNYHVAYLEDDGGTIPRKQLRQRLNVEWAYRMMRVTLFGQYSDDEFGTTTRTDNRVVLQITREF